MAQKVFSLGSGREQGGVRGRAGEGVRSQNPGARRTGVRWGLANEVDPCSGGEPLIRFCSYIGGQQAAPGSYPWRAIDTALRNFGSSNDFIAQTMELAWRLQTAFREPPAAYLQNCHIGKAALARGGRVFREPFRRLPLVKKPTNYGCHNG